MANFNFKITDNNISLVKQIEKQTLVKTLTAWGILAQGYATDYCPKDTGNLANSINYGVVESDMQMQVGTNVTYAPYVELGTGIYAEEGNGRKTPWVYQDDEGRWHRTSGMHAQPYLRPAIEKHIDQYKEILLEYLNEQI